ncbi:MAG: metallophosphoesterase family protein [Nitrosomonas sp.]|nr:metallophosphoesterase family protein [Nitrosomonas sp.]
MRIAVVSDIHGNLPALEAVVSHFKRIGIDKVINLGDSLSGPLLPLETAQFLMAQDWIHLAGNHDYQILAHESDQCSDVDKLAYSQLSTKELDWLKSLPNTLYLNQDILLCHGTPESSNSYLLETVMPYGARLATINEIKDRLGKDKEAKLILCGHTHQPRSVKVLDDLLIVNPGSVGLPAYSDGTPFFHTIETGTPDAHYALLERTGNQWVSSLVTVPYNHQAMVKLAESYHFMDWAYALETGFMN